MVMMGVSSAVSGVALAEDSSGRGRYDASFDLLHKEIRRHAQEVASIHDNGTAAQKAVATEASAIIASLAEEALTPCAIYVGSNVDAWDERVKHLRGMTEMTKDLIMQSVIEQSGVEENDPRLAKLEPIADDIARFVSRPVEASIEAANPRDASPAAGMTI